MARKKLVRNYSVNVLFAGAMLFAPVMVADLNAAPTQTNQVTWTNTKRGTDTTGTKFGGQVIKDSYIMQKSSTGQTRRIRTGYELYKYDYDQRLTYSESWKYNELGKAKEKNVTQYLKGTTRYDYQKTYKWVKPGQGSSYLAKESYYNRSSYDLTRKEYNSKGYLTRLTVTGKKDTSHTVTTYTRNSSNKVTKKVVEKYGKYYDDRKLKTSETSSYYPNGKVKSYSLNQYSLKTWKTIREKNVYNTFYENGKKKLARDTYYLSTEFTSVYENKAKREVRENHYNSKGIKTKNIIRQYEGYSAEDNDLKKEEITTYYSNGKTKKQINLKEFYNSSDNKRSVTRDTINTFYSNGNKKLARDTYYQIGNKLRMELKENNYNSKGKKTKSVYNDFNSEGKKKLARDTYYYANGKTKKEVRESHYLSSNKLTMKVLKQYYSNGKIKLIKDTYYYNGDISEVRQTTYSTNGKKKSTTKEY